MQGFTNSTYGQLKKWDLFPLSRNRVPGSVVSGAKLRADIQEASSRERALSSPAQSLEHVAPVSRSHCERPFILLDAFGIKHGNGNYTIYIYIGNCPIETPFRVDVQLPRLITRGYIQLIGVPSSICGYNKCTQPSQEICQNRPKTYQW